MTDATDTRSLWRIVNILYLFFPFSPQCWSVSINLHFPLFEGTNGKVCNGNKFRENSQISQKSPYARLRWILWEVDKEVIRKTTTQTDLATSWFTLDVTGWERTFQVLNPFILGGNAVQNGSKLALQNETTEGRQVSFRAVMSNQNCCK